MVTEETKETQRTQQDPFQQRIISSAIRACSSDVNKHTRNREEIKEPLHLTVLSNRPLRSGDLACEEELSLEESIISRNLAYHEEEQNAEMIKAVFCNKPASSPHADIIDYFLHHQHKYEVQPDILDDSKQRHINWKMRALLLDWMIEVTSEFKLHRETFYLAMNYLDRYIGKVYHVEKRNYQLIGTAALLLACKVEEIYTPRISYFILATDHGYTQAQILDMERNLCMELEWDLTPASLETWTRLC